MTSTPAFDFVVQVGPTAPEVEPKNVLKTQEANEALHHAYQWATAKADSNASAANAKVYIEAIELNRAYEPRNPDRADYTQLLYIVSNLTHWRGEHSKESRKALKAYGEAIKSY
tara:strand:+ start:345 stop:686 length:342 start_codon:yes stop_codon:yes gene_type:complete